jgi:hypothetical protein
LFTLFIHFVSAIHFSLARLSLSVGPPSRTPLPSLSLRTSRRSQPLKKD